MDFESIAHEAEISVVLRLHKNSVIIDILN